MLRKLFGLIFIWIAFRGLFDVGLSLSNFCVFLLFIAIGMRLLLGKEWLKKILNKDFAFDSGKNFSSVGQGGIKILSSDDFIVLDTETTGLSAEKDEILQLSIIDAQGNVLFDSLIKPLKRKRWTDATRINGISPQMVKDSPTIEDMEADIQHILDKASSIAGYNTEFDLGFLEAAGFNVSKPYYDLMKDFAPIYGEWSDYYGDWKYPKLVECAKYFGYTYNAHSALEDAKATLYCMLQLDELKKSGQYDLIVKENRKNR